MNDCSVLARDKNVRLADKNVRRRSRAARHHEADALQDRRAEEFQAVAPRK
jgi:hypothetical protein